MKYWDASALVPLIVDEPGTELARAWLAEDPHVVTWALTRLEIASAVERQYRERRITPDRRAEVLSGIDALARAWDEVSDVVPVVERGLALLARYPLRAADAAQLAAASVFADGTPWSVSFVCLDRELAEAARREGFRVLTWPDGPA